MQQVMDFAAKISLEDGFLDDVLPNRNFTVEIQAVDDQCSASVAAKASLPLFLGKGQQEGRIYSANTSEPVVAISGCGCSGTAAVISNLGTPFKVTMVSGAATSPDLSNKALYPYFARVIPPDSSQGSGMARLVTHFGWKWVVSLYTRQAYAEGIATAFMASMAQRDPTVNVVRTPVPYQPLNTVAHAAALNFSQVQAVAQAVFQLRPQPRIFVFPGDPADAGPILRAFEEVGLVSNKTVWIMAESACSMNGLSYVAMNQERFASSGNPLFANGTGSYNWSRIPTVMRGMICLQPIARGPRYYSPQWTAFWTSLTRERLLAAGMPANFFSNPVWFTDLKELSTMVYYPLMFDAMTTFLFAYGEQLRKGTPPEQIRGDVLRAAVMEARFEGLSGSIAFDKNGDRLAPYRLINVQAGPTLADVGEFNGAADSIAFTRELLFADGTTEVPADRPAPCSAGFEYSGKGCTPCPPGSFAPNVDSVCIRCSPGTYAASSGTSACMVAPRGTSVPGGGFAAPINCAPGTYSPDSGATECEDCLPGMAQALAGQSSCGRCEVGTFAGRRASSCQTCPSGLTTEYPGATNATDCQCMLGFFADEHGDCLPCPQGMTCPFGAAYANFAAAAEGRLVQFPAPQLQRGFYSRWSEPLKVYRCMDTESCAGGLPETCANGRTGLNCALCPDGTVLDKGECSPCSEINQALPPLALVGVFVLVVAAYYSTNSPVRSNTSASLALSVALSLMVTNAQLLGTLGLLKFPWPRSTKSSMTGVQFILFDVDTISPACLLGGGAAAMYSLRFIIPFLVVVAFGSIYALSRLVALRRPDAGWDPYKTLNSMGTVFQLLFIALTGIVTVPFQCYTHPYGGKSLQRYPEVICGEPDHTPLLVMGLLLLLLIVLPFLVITCYGIRKSYVDSQENQANSRYLVVFRFLFFRYRPDVWWWALPFTARQTLLAFAPAVQPDDPHAQLVYVQLVLLVYGIGVCRFWPWKSPELNLIDAGSVSLLIAMLLAVSSLMPASPRTGWQDTFITTLVALLGAVGGVLMLLALLTLARKGLNADFNLGRHLPRAFQSYSHEGLAQDLQKLGIQIAVLSPALVSQLVDHMNSYDKTVVSQAISCIQASSMGAIWISKEVPARLAGVGHSSNRLSQQDLVTAVRRSSKRATSFTAADGKASVHGEPEASQFAASIHHAYV